MLFVIKFDYERYVIDLIIYFCVFNNKLWNEDQGTEMTTLHVAAALPDDHNKLLSPGLTNVVCRILSTLQATEIIL